MNDLFDIQAVFFSRYGSYLSLSHTSRGVPDGLYLRHIRGGVVHSEVFRLELLHRGTAIPFTEQLYPTELHLQSEYGNVKISFIDVNTLQLWGSGSVSLRFFADSTHSEYDTAWKNPKNTIYTVHYRAELKCQFTASTGQVTLDAPWLGARTQHINVTFSGDSNGQFDGQLHTFLSIPQILSPNDTTEHYTAWHKASLPVPERYAPAHELATYINWAGVVHPRGHLARPAMYMSKNWMCKIWGWDNCFNALAHVQQDPELAWNQLMLFVDHQGADGAFPDHITDVTKSFRFYKPPVFGWVIQRMMSRTDAITDEHLAEIYPALCRWTNWWFHNRDDDADGLPQYNHGNESGWDNGTPFAQGVPVESPDLTTYLILQMDFLAQIAHRLHQVDAAFTWSERADTLFKRMIMEQWDGEQFRARHALTHQIVNGDSLLMYMPLLLGQRLPQDIQDKLVSGVQRFLTPYGLATEHPNSPYYISDGYWRGPIWAPSTYLIVDGLLQCHADALALDIAQRFCDMALHNGMAENYDALSGVGLRDRAYTWTSSVFLLLGNLLLTHQQENEPLST